LHERGMALTRRLWDGLSQVRGIRLYGPPPTARRTPTIAFRIDGADCEPLVRRFADAALFVSHGDFYAATVIERLGVPEVIRVGCGAYTTEEEVDRLLAAI
jgi:selenocysteine lyase/cysteine desulfurase